MRLSNENDQDIIRSAIPNSSVSTTSFLSSIGNGEAIAFGEAISVPMRIRFNRVPTHILPKASGVAPPVAEDTPDTVDLRSIVKRMRAVSGPDISGFRQSYEANIAKNADDDELDSWKQAFNEDSSNSQEPYRPEMLPRSSVFSQKVHTQVPDPAVKAEPARNVFSEDARPSLRDSLLKKPLGSLYRKD
jgi:hypothetical protein